MIIQPLLFPKQEVCPEQKMYYRIKEDKISLETYFNAFSIGKWKKYTDLDNLYFEVESEEALQFTCVHAVGSVAADGACRRLPAFVRWVSRSRITETKYWYMVVA